MRLKTQSHQPLILAYSYDSSLTISESALKKAFLFTGSGSGEESPSSEGLKVMRKEIILHEELYRDITIPHNTKGLHAGPGLRMKTR